MPDSSTLLATGSDSSNANAGNANAKNVKATISWFSYTAIDLASGRLVSGRISSADAFLARQQLRESGLAVEHIQLAQATGAAAWIVSLRNAWHARCRRQRRHQRADLCDAVATLIDAGQPLDQALASLAVASARSPAERRMLADICAQVRAGVSFAESCRAHPGWFDAMDVGMIDTGQQAGELSAVLRHLSEFHQRGAALGAKLLASLAYPVALLIAGIAATIFLATVPLPKMLAMLANSKQEAPWLTTTLVAIGQTLATWWPAILGGIAVMVVAIPRLMQRLPSHSTLGALWRRQPIARIRVRAGIAQIAFTLSRLRRCGVPLVDALLMTAGTLPQGRLRLLLEHSAEGMRRGQDLSAQIAAADLDEPEFAQLLHVGERSGELTALLDRIAARYDRAARSSIERAAAILGPAAIVILGLLIGLIALAAILPIVQLGNAL